MNRLHLRAWVVSVCVHAIRRSRAKTLGALVAGAMGVERVSLASPGRHLLGPVAVKHGIKRAYRFIKDFTRLVARDA